MSDPNATDVGQAPAEQSLSDIVLAAPEKIWRKIKQALGVKERQEAADLVGSDPQAAAIVRKLLAAAPATPKEGEPPLSPAERIYGRPKGGQGLKF